MILLKIDTLERSVLVSQLLYFPNKITATTMSTLAPCVPAHPVRNVDFCVLSRLLLYTSGYVAPWSLPTLVAPPSALRPMIFWLQPPSIGIGAICLHLFLSEHGVKTYRLSGSHRDEIQMRNLTIRQQYTVIPKTSALATLWLVWYGTT